MSDRRIAERLLGIRLAPEASRVRCFRHQPSDQLEFFETFVRFEGPESAFDTLVASLGLGRRGRDPQALGHLPASWALPPGVELSWWDPSGKTGEQSAARDFGTNGSIVAKHEGRAVYLVVTDTGSTTGTSGGSPPAS